MNEIKRESDEADREHYGCGDQEYLVCKTASEQRYEES